MLATGAKTVEKISITLLNMNLSYAVIIDEKTLIGKAMAVLNAIITINILSLSTSCCVRPLEKHESVHNININPPIITKTDTIPYIIKNKPNMLLTCSFLPSALYLHIYLIIVLPNPKFNNDKIQQ